MLFLLHNWTISYLESITTSSKIYVWSENNTRFNQKATLEYFQLRSANLERQLNGVTNTLPETGSLTIPPTTQTERKESFQDNYGVGQLVIIAKGQRSYQSAIRIQDPD